MIQKAIQYSISNPKRQYRTNPFEDNAKILRYVRESSKQSILARNPLIKSNSERIRIHKIRSSSSNENMHNYWTMFRILEACLPIPEDVDELAEVENNIPVEFIPFFC